MDTQADVRPVGKGEVRAGADPIWVEVIGVRETGRVAVGGGDRDADQLALADVRPRQVDVGRCIAVDDRGRGLEPERLLDGRVEALWVPGRICECIPVLE